MFPQFAAVMELKLARIGGLQQLCELQAVGYQRSAIREPPSLFASGTTTSFSPQPPALSGARTLDRANIPDHERAEIGTRACLLKPSPSAKNEPSPHHLPQPSAMFIPMRRLAASGL